jgi:hypothetical protein
MLNLTSSTARVMGVTNQRLLGGNNLTDSNVSDALRTIGSITGTSIAQNKVFSVVYSIARKFGLTSKFNLVDCGTPESIMSQVPLQYKINISGISSATDINRNSKTLYNIDAILQDKIDLKTTSTWEKVTPNSFSELGNTISQGVLGLSLASSLATRRIWTGTEPLRFVITFKFEAQEDARKEVVLPSLVLQQMSLPGRSATGSLEWFLIPPGPAPFPSVASLVENLGNNISKSMGGEVGSQLTGLGEEITIRIGNFLEFKKIILESVNTTYESRFDINGDPLGAISKVEFSTYEIMTKEKLEESYLTISGGQSVQSMYQR